MKILHIFDTYGIPEGSVLPGGKGGSVASVVYYLAKFTAAKGYDVTVLERDLGKLPREEFSDGIKYFRINAESLPAHPYRLIKGSYGLFQLLMDGFSIAKKLNAFIKETNFDVIHVHFPFAVSILISLKRDIRRKMVYTAHIGEERKRFNFDGSAPPPLSLFQPDKYLMKRINKSVVLNENLKKELVDRCWLKEKNLEVISNGVEVSEFNNTVKLEKDIEAVKIKFGINNIDLILLFVGKIIPRKGVEHLIKATKSVVDLGFKDFSLVLAGDLNLDKEFSNGMLQYIKNNNLEDFVKFTGFVSYSDLRALYSLSNIFVLPSFEEGSPLVLIEALASGKPLIGSDVGGIPMQIRDGWNGFLVEPGNGKQLAEKIRHLIENEEDRKRMGVNSRKLAEKEFSWEKIVKKYLDIYEGIIE